MPRCRRNCARWCDGAEPCYGTAPWSGCTLRAASALCSAMLGLGMRWRVGGLVCLCPTSATVASPHQCVVLVPRRTRTYVRTHSREAHLQKQIEQLTAQAREKKKKGDKNGALFCLKKRKMLQGQQEKLSAARLNLETMQLTIGSAKYVGPCAVWCARRWRSVRPVHARRLAACARAGPLSVRGRWRLLLRCSCCVRGTLLTRCFVLLRLPLRTCVLQHEPRDFDGHADRCPGTGPDSQQHVRVLLCHAPPTYPHPTVAPLLTGRWLCIAMHTRTLHLQGCGGC